MREENDGPAIARQRIAQEALECTGILDLGRLGLTELPEDLFRLKHLRRLNLGVGIFDKDGEWLESSADIAPNDFEPSLDRLTDLPELQFLSVSGSRLASLTFIAGLPGLRTLVCSSTQVSDLGPLAGLTALQRLSCSSCHLTNLPEEFLHKLSLEKLVLYNSRLLGVPAAVLSQSYDDNCLEALRAHFSDLAAGLVAVPDVKLMVLGNGQVGKTQLCRRLRGEAYDATVPSTHGILVTSAPLPTTEGGPAARLHIWDFGGQDIYHGTHTLFLRTSAIFLLAWTPTLEDSQEQEHDGIIFRNHPLAYWVEYVRHLGDTSSPVLVH